MVLSGCADAVSSPLSVSNRSAEDWLPHSFMSTVAAANVAWPHRSTSVVGVNHLKGVERPPCSQAGHGHHASLAISQSARHNERSLREIVFRCDLQQLFVREWPPALMSWVVLEEADSGWVAVKRAEKESTWYRGMDWALKTALWRRSAGDAGRPRRCAAPPQISPLRNLTPKKWDMNGHLISIIFDHNIHFMGIPVKKRDMNAIGDVNVGGKTFDGPSFPENRHIYADAFEDLMSGDDDDNDDDDEGLGLGQPVGQPRRRFILSDSDEDEDTDTEMMDIDDVNADDKTFDDPSFPENRHIYQQKLIEKQFDLVVISSGVKEI